MNEDALDIGRSALELADEAIDFAAELGVTASRLDAGTTIVDLGIEATGSLDAGLLLAAARRGGQLAAEVHLEAIGPHAWPSVEATTTHPDSCRSVTTTESVAGYTISGPGVVGETDPFAVVTAIGTEPVDEESAAALASMVGVPPEDLYVLALSPGSPAWRVDAAVDALEAATAAVAEVASVSRVREAIVSAPLPPASADPAVARAVAGTVRQAGARVHLVVDRVGDGPVDVHPAGDANQVPAVMTVASPGGGARSIGELDEDTLTDAIEP